MEPLPFKKYKISGSLEAERFTFSDSGEAIFVYEFRNPVKIVSLIVDEYLPDGDYETIKYYVSVYGNIWHEIIPLNRNIAEGKTYFVSLPISSKKIYVKIKMTMKNGISPYIETLTIKGK